MLCVHCRQRPGSRPRFLCWRCGADPAIRAQHPPSKNYHRAEVQDFCGGHQLPEPTEHLSGTAEKLAVLEARAQARLALHHPQDGRRE